MKKEIIILLLFAIAFSVQSQGLEKIDTYLSESLADWGIPGMSVAIVKDGKVVLAKGYGLKDINGSAKVDDNTLFAIASNTKAFISSSLAILVAEGKCDWNDPVKKYIPDFEMYNDYVTNNTTIADLLSHRAGLGTFSGDMMWYKSDLGVDELIKKIKYLEPAYPFRSGYGYSNLMFITAGEVIKRITNQEWDEFVKDQFFDPLKMDRTIASTNDLKAKSNYAMPHKPFEGETKTIPWVNWDNMGAAGGIISSAKDMAQWMIMHLQNGVFNGDTILQPKLQNVTWTAHNTHVLSQKAKKTVPGRHFNGYGLGWSLNDYYGNLMVGHSGGYDGMYSRVMMLPDENLGIVILTNSMKGNTFPLSLYIVNQFIEEDMRDWSETFLNRKSGAQDQVQARIDALKKARVKKSKPTLALEKYTGNYQSEMHGNVTVKVSENNLLLTFDDAPALSATLTHWHNDTWQVNWNETHAWFDFGLVTFKIDNTLKVLSMNIEVPNYDIFFDEVDLLKVELN
jgi:CubicO group peptidase (beta-lactamase class C family)